jgi:hypothetical protein
MTQDFKVIHHHSLDLVSEPETWIAAHMRVAEKWDGKMPGVGEAGGDWKQRARRGEAEAAAARAGAVTAQLKAEAHARQLEREIAVMRESIGWRLTEPLRRANALRRKLRPGRSD